MDAIDIKCQKFMESGKLVVNFMSLVIINFKKLNFKNVTIPTSPISGKKSEK